MHRQQPAKVLVLVPLLRYVCFPSTCTWCKYQVFTGRSTATTRHIFLGATSQSEKDSFLKIEEEGHAQKDFSKVFFCFFM